LSATVTSVDGLTMGTQAVADTGGTWEEVDAEVEEAEDAQGDQEHDQHEGEDRAADANFGKGHG